MREKTPPPPTRAGLEREAESLRAQLRGREAYNRTHQHGTPVLTIDLERSLAAVEARLATLPAAGPP